ncbi:DUF6928 family protein [Corynebacterium mayonis]|uniref:DUF6928 family protein n=1 Tax=Corynebacterium mayonis TaxID=3062461 RepID=UPI00314030BF
MDFPSVVTFWFVDTASPSEVITNEPKPNRGFGRKLLAQLNPAWPITPIGEFPLNRSSHPGPSEFYIAGFPGIAVVQTYVEKVGALSNALLQLRQCLPAKHVYVTAVGTNSDFAAFAHFCGTETLRAFAATRETVIEDMGLPESFELPFWSGEKAKQVGGIALPFVPKDLAHAAQESWLGTEISPDGPDIHVVGYAVDGRAEPKIEPSKRPTKSVAEVAAKFAEKDKGYDDYEVAAEEPDGGEFAQFADASVAVVKRWAKSLKRKAGSMRDSVVERIRHSDR